MRDGNIVPVDKSQEEEGLFSTASVADLGEHSVADLGEHSVADLGEQIAELAAQINAATYRLLCMIREFDERGGWHCGFCSCAHWLNWRIGLGLVAAREKVRVARALPTLPKIARALEHGEISYSKVRALTRIATPQTEESLLVIASAGTAAHVEKLVRRYRKADLAAEMGQAQQQQEERYLRTRYDAAGMFVIEGRLPPEVGAFVQRALDLAMEQLRQPKARCEALGAPDDSAEAFLSGADSPGDVTTDAKPGTFVQRQADALGLVAQSALDHELRTGSGADRTQVVIHVDDKVLANPQAGGRSHLQDGPTISAETARRLACDAAIVPLLADKRGVPLKLGRKHRVINGTLLRALKARDDGCRFPGCTHSRHLKAHHVKHWAQGGKTNMENLVALCDSHHRLVHEGGYRVEERAGRVGEFVFLDPAGKTISRAGLPKRITSNAVQTLDQAHCQQGLEIGPGNLSRWGGEIMDYDQAITGLLLQNNRLRT